MAELSGKKILVLVTNQGVEQDELKVPADKLRADGAGVTVAAPESGEVKSLVGDWDRGETFPVDQTISSVNESEYDLLLLPGGTLNADALRLNEDAQEIARRMGFEAMGEDDAVRHAKTLWHHKIGGRGAEYVFQTRARPDSLNRCLQALRPQGTVIDLAFYQGGMDGARLGEEFHHNGLSIRCAQINRMPRPVAAAWDQRRLAQETLHLLADEGDLIREHMITHVVPYDDAPGFLRHLVKDRPEFLQIVFAHE